MSLIVVPSALLHLFTALAERVVISYDTVPTCGTAIPILNANLKGTESCRFLFPEAGSHWHRPMTSANDTWK